MLSRYTPLEDVLRRALAHAGIVEGWKHVCRKKGCEFVELATDSGLRHCPKHGMKLWPKANVRQIRFHDLRHTTASLLMMADANPAAVQRILRHSDPRITTETYGHLQPGYLRTEIDRLRFVGPQASKISNGSQPEAGNGRQLVTSLSQGTRASSIVSGKERSNLRIRFACCNRAPSRTRTCNPRLRRPVLYPVELWARTAPQSLLRLVFCGGDSVHAWLIRPCWTIRRRRFAR